MGKATNNVSWYKKTFEKVTLDKLKSYRKLHCLVINTTVFHLMSSLQVNYLMHMYSWHLKQLHFRNDRCSTNNSSEPTAMIFDDSSISLNVEMSNR